MKFEIDEMPFMDEWYKTYRPFVPGDLAPAQTFLDTCFQAIFEDMKEQINTASPGCGDHIYTLSPNPYTILRPREIPDYTTDLPNDLDLSPEEFYVWLEERWGYAGDDVEMYGRHMDLPNEPFTVIGTWSDNFEVSGSMGFIVSKPKTLVVLFC